MTEIFEFIEILLSSKMAVASICLLWVFIENKSHKEDKKTHIEERIKWTETLEKLTTSLNTTIKYIEYEKWNNSESMRKRYEKKHDHED